MLVKFDLVEPAQCVEVVSQNKMPLLKDATTGLLVYFRNVRVDSASFERGKGLPILDEMVAVVFSQVCFIKRSIDR